MVQSTLWLSHQVSLRSLAVCGHIAFQTKSFHCCGEGVGTTSSGFHGFVWVASALSQDGVGAFMGIWTVLDMSTDSTAVTDRDMATMLGLGGLVGIGK